METSNSRSLSVLRQLSNDSLAQSLLVYPENSEAVRKILHERMSRAGVAHLAELLRLKPPCRHTAAIINDAAAAPVERIMFQDMVEMEELRDVNRLLISHVDEYWHDEKIKQRWEVTDFLSQTSSSTYYDMTTKMQNFYRRIINGYNKWVTSQQHG